MPDGSMTLSTQPNPKSLKAVLRDYRRIYREYCAALKAVDVLEKDKPNLAPELLVAERTATQKYEAARAALIDAPVTTRADIVAKLRFYFEVSGNLKMFDNPPDWESEIVKNILRDIDKPCEAGQSWRELESAYEHEATPSKRLLSGREIEALWLAHEQAEDAVNSRSDAGFERIRALYPKAPPNVARHFLIRGNWCVEHPAPVQEAELLENVERWERYGPHSPPCQHAMKLLTDWRAWDAECAAIYEREGGPQLEAEDDAIEERYHQAGERFVEAPTVDPLGILLKLEYVAKVEGFVDQLEENPNLHEPKVILQLIRDLKDVLGRP